MLLEHKNAIGDHEMVLRRTCIYKNDFEESYAIKARLWRIYFETTYLGTN